MPHQTEIIILTFEDILKAYNSKLADFGSLITNRKEGGAYDLSIRVFCLMIADGYEVVNDSLPLVFPSHAVGEWMDLHAEAVGLVRLEATKTVKEFICRREIDGGVVQIPVDDILKTPVLPSRGELRFFTIHVELVDLTGTADVTSDELVDNGTDFIAEGVKVGTFLFNQTDGSYGIITEVKQHKLIAKLQFGTLNTWTVGDSYKTQKPSDIAGEFTTRSATATAADPTGALLTDSGAGFLAENIQLGTKVYNIDDESEGIITALTDTTITAQLKKADGSDGSWSIGDEYKLTSDLEVRVRAEADVGGTAYNNMELLLGRDGQEVEVNIEKGFTGVDTIVSTGGDLIAGTDDETDDELRARIAGQWKALARGATKDGYRQFAINSSPVIFDANVFKGDGATDVEIVLSGVAGSRDVSEQLGIKVDAADNFDSLYTDDGNPTGIPRPVGIAVHEYIRARAPLTDFIILSSVTEQPQNLEVNVKVADGFDFETEIKPEVQKRLRALFLPEPTVKDVKVVGVGEDLLYSKVCKVLNDTAGVEDFTFVLPDPATNDGNIDIDDNKVFSLGTITVGEL